MRNRKVIAGVLAIALLGGIICVRMYQTYDPYRHITLLRPSKMINVKPAGEIIDDFVIMQRIYHTGSSIDIKNDIICIHLYLANYSNRRNTGKMKVTLYDGTQLLSASVEYREVDDNAFELVCFGDEVYQLGNGDLILTIKGEGGKPGSSITAWLTEDTSMGRVVVNGEEKQASLVLGLASKHPCRKRVAVAMVLSLFPVGLSAILVSLAARKDWTC
jgi:hypothetical protein